MASTDIYGIAIFDFGEQLDSPLNVQKEIQRMTLIDTQLYAMASVFGDGVISGWAITKAGDFSIYISPGIGLVNGFAIETIYTSSISDLTTNSVINIFAQPNSNSPVDRSVNIITSTGNVIGALLLGTVTTAGLGITNIDVTAVSKVGFSSIIEQILAVTRHNGVSAPKIDLSQEVQGQLPASRIANIDASKITSGRIPISVLPKIDHNSLKNKGMLTHPQLDSIVSSITNDNIALLGEVSSINLMKMIIYLKYLDSNIDRNFENELAIIPGVSPDSVIDFTNTNAIVDFDTNCIGGVPAFTGDIASALDSHTHDGSFQFVTVNFDDTEFKTAIINTNLAISNGAKLNIDVIHNRIVDDFEGAGGSAVPNYVGTLIETNTTQVVYDTSHVQGDTSARFFTNNTRNAQFLKTFSTVQDWSTFDTINIFVRNFSSVHAAVTLEISDPNSNVIGSFVLLSANEDVTNENLSSNGFALRKFSIASLPRTTIGSIRIFTDIITNSQEIFNIDTIYLSTNTYLLPQGNLRLRYNTTAPVIFNSLDYTATIPHNTDLRIRVRVAGTLEELVSSTFSDVLQTGEVFSIAGSYIEIDVTLLSDTGRTLTPILSDIILSMLVPASDSGVNISSLSAWNQYVDKTNIEVVPEDDSNAYVKMQYVNINDFYFSNSNQVSELSPSLLPIIGIPSQGLPISPLQGQNILFPPKLSEDPYEVDRKDIRGFFKPLSVYKLGNSNFIIADTYNDRILEIEPDGTFVRGYGSHNFDLDDEKLFAVTSCYNPRLGVLFVTLSQSMDVRNFDLNLIGISIVGVANFSLNNSADQIRLLDGTVILPAERTPGANAENPPANLLGTSSRVLSVLLSPANRAIMNSNLTKTAYTSISSNIATQLECFIGDFMYLGEFSIFTPIYANYSTDDRIIVCNAGIVSSLPYAVKTFPPLLEFNVRMGEQVDGQETIIGSSFIYDQILFSDMMLGSAQVIRSTVNGVALKKVIIAGIVYPKLHVFGENKDTPDIYTPVLSPLDDKKMALFTGVVRMVDMISGIQIFQYQSPDGLWPTDAYQDNDGNIVIAESSFTPQSGRIVTIDPNGIEEGQQPPIINLIDGGGVYTKIWDIRKLKNGHMYVST